MIKLIYHFKICFYL